jgi:hypothetical protein
MNSEPTQYIQKMIQEFKIPGHDAITECLLAAPGKQAPIWDSAILISTGQAKHFYTDIFQFWVRAFFCFVEDIQAGPLFDSVIPSIDCRPISPEEFQHDYVALIRQRNMDPSFIESQQYPQTFVELEKRTFKEPYTVLHRPDIKSAVTHSNGEYLAYFVMPVPGKQIHRV